MEELNICKYQQFSKECHCELMDPLNKIINRFKIKNYLGNSIFLEGFIIYLQAPIAERLLFLFETLGVSTSILEPVPCLLQLPMAVTCYWTKFSEPKVTLQHIKALLLGITFGELDKMLHVPGRFRKDQVQLTHGFFQLKTILFI